MSSTLTREAFLPPNNPNLPRTQTMTIQSLLNPAEDTYRTRSLSGTTNGDDDRSRGSTSPDSTEDIHPVQIATEDLRRNSSRSSSSARERREFRPTYLQEEEYFIWYHRIDLGMDWTDVRQAYNVQFPQRQRRGFQGIQCKYYRCCEAYGVPRVRDRNRAASPADSYGVRSRLPGLWYPWMRHPPPQPR